MTLSPLWILIILAVGLLAGLILRARPRRGFAVGTLILSMFFAFWAGLGPAPLVQAASPHLNPSGVPITPNDQVVLTESLTHQGMLLDAEATPLIFMATWALSSRQVATLQKSLAQLPGLHRPLILVSTFFHQPRTAIATTQTWMRRDHVTLPVVVQEGPPTLYVHAVPVMLTAHQGHLVRYAGMPAILAHLRAAVVIPSTPPPKISHRSSPAKQSHG